MAKRKIEKDEAGGFRRRAEKIARERERESPRKLEVISPAESRILHELRVHQIELEMQNEELRLTQQQLEQSRERYFSLYDLAPVGYLTISQKGLILEANLSASRMIGVERGKLVKQRFTRFISQDHQDNYYLHHRRLFHTAQPQKSEMRMLKNDGTVFWVHLEANLAQGTESPPVCRVVITDITEHKQAEAKTLEIEALKVINQAKSELLANVSHELRTPLASIKGNIETLIETDVKWSKKQQMEFLQSAVQQTDRLTMLIRDLLDMSRIDSGKLVLEQSSYSAEEILDSVSGVLSVISATHKLKVILARGLPPLQADKVRIGQIITNLVENAVKFSPAGSLIEIEASLKAGKVIFSVEDQGVGMPPEVIFNLFNRFYQARQVVEGKSKGTGLGLAICKGIVDAHGGKIWIESQPGKGSKFSFSIPVVNTR